MDVIMRCPICTDRKLELSWRCRECDGKFCSRICAEGHECKCYVLQNSGFSGDFIKFWREQGKGYTFNFTEAWRMTKEKAEELAKSRPNEDIPRKLKDCLAACQTVVNFELLQNPNPTP